MTVKWEDLTPDERFRARLDRWLEPDTIEFDTPIVKDGYAARVQRVIDAITLKQSPDRIPVISPAGFLPCFLYGATCREVMYDIDLAIDLWERFALEYPTDLIKAPSYQGTGKAMEMLDYRLYKWPGHGLPDHVAFQAMESEWMKKDEYEILLDDPSDLWLRHYLPRVFGAFEPLAELPRFTDIVEIPDVGALAAFGRPGMRETLNNLADAGLEMLKVKSRLGQFVYKAINTHGYAFLAGAGAKAPFDVVADTVRGSRHMMTDMYRDSDKILKAVERLTPLQIRKGVTGVNASGNPLVFMPLHKGADGFMSDAQFATMYWPSLKAVILGLIEEGCIPFLFAEGGYNSRLEYLKELPKGKTLWHFDQTDMAAAKKTIGDTVCIAGNVPSDMMVTGTADQVEDCCRKLIDDCAPGGGYILTTGAIIDEGKPDTMRALLDAVDRFGRYH